MLVAKLVSMGHTNAPDYGYSFFLFSCKAIQEIQSEMARVIAASVCNGINLALSGKEEYERFVKGK